MTNNSRKAWAIIRRLGADHITPPTLTTVTANSVARQLVLNGRSQTRRRPTGEYRRTAVPDHPQPASALTKPFDPEELEAALCSLKPGKTAGIDDVLAEMILHLGPKAKIWLLEMLNTCMAKKTIPPVWRKAKTVAIPKPGKDPSSPKNYRPISLLCITDKLYERLLLQRVTPLIDSKLTKDQAGFRPGRSCAGQLLNLT